MAWKTKDYIYDLISVNQQYRCRNREEAARGVSSESLHSVIVYLPRISETIIVNMAATPLILHVHPHFNAEEAAHAAAEFVSSESKHPLRRLVTQLTRNLQASITSLAR